MQADPPPPIGLIGLGLIAPVIIGIVTGLALRLLRRPGDNPPRLLWLPPLALGLALLGAYISVAGFPRFNAMGIEQRGLIAALVAVLLSAVAGLPRLRDMGAIAILCTVAVAVPPIVLFRQLASAPSWDFAVTPAVAILVAAGSLMWLEATGRPRAAGIIAVGLAFASGACLAAAGDLKLGQYAFAVGGALAAMLVFIPRAAEGWLGTPAFIAAAAIVAIPLIGHPYASFTPVPQSARILLAIAAPLGLFLGGLKVVRDVRGYRSARARRPGFVSAALPAAVMIAGAAVPALIAVLITAAPDSALEPDPYNYGY